MYRSFISRKKISKVIVCLILGLMLLLIPGKAYTDKLNKSKDKLNKINEQLETKKSQVKKIDEKEKSVLELLDEIDKKLSTDKKNLSKLDRELKSLEKEIKISRKHLKTSEESLNQYKKRLSQRVRAIYKYGRMNLFEIVLTSSSTNQFLMKYKLLKIIAVSDSQLIKKLEHENQIYREKSEEMALKLNKLIHLKEITEQELKKISKEKQSRKELLNDFRTKKQNYEKEIKDLENNSKMLKEFIAGMLSKEDRSKDDTSKILIQLKGLLSWPVEGKIIGKFGKYNNEEFNVEMFRDGIEIDAKKGELVKVALSGNVKYSGWFKGKGNMIIIEHKYGISTIYGHLDDVYVEKGDYVKAGERIGKVGNTSSLKGYLLYFGVWYKNKAINPEILLK